MSFPSYTYNLTGTNIINHQVVEYTVLNEIRIGITLSATYGCNHGHYTVNWNDCHSNLRNYYCEMVQMHKKCIHQNHLRLRNSLYHLASKRKHCKRNVYLACVLSLLLLLAGDVELNPGPYHNNEISSLPASAAKLSDDQSEKRAESEARRSSRLSILSTYQRNCLENGTR